MDLTGGPAKVGLLVLTAGPSVHTASGPCMNDLRVDIHVAPCTANRKECDVAVTRIPAYAVDMEPLRGVAGLERPHRTGCAPWRRLWDGSHVGVRGVPQDVYYSASSAWPKGMGLKIGRDMRTAPACARVLRQRQPGLLGAHITE